MLSTLRSLWAWVAITVLIVVWLPWLALVRLFDRDPALYRTGRWFRRLGAAMTRANPAWRVQVLGITVENPRLPYVVVCNHQSLADIPVVSCLPWEMKWVGKEELFRIPFAGWMMQLAGDISLDRDDPRSGARMLMQVRQYLQRDCSVIFFPEGTRSRDGRVYPFTDGAFRIAIKEQVPILPLALDGTAGALPKHSWRFGAPSTIRLEVLPPIPTAGLKAADTAALREQARQAIITRIAEWRGTPPDTVDAALSVDAEHEDKASVNTAGG